MGISIPIEEIQNPYQYSNADDGTHESTKQESKVLAKRIEFKKEAIKLFEESHI